PSKIAQEHFAWPFGNMNRTAPRNLELSAALPKQHGNSSRTCHHQVWLAVLVHIAKNDTPRRVANSNRRTGRERKKFLSLRCGAGFQTALRCSRKRRQYKRECYVQKASDVVHELISQNKSAIC